jgi:hypothetical protein
MKISGARSADVKASPNNTPRDCPADGENCDTSKRYVRFPNIEQIKTVTATAKPDSTNSRVERAASTPNIKV